MIQITVNLKVSEKNQAAMKNVLKQLVEKSSIEKGCNSYGAFISREDANEWLIVENWADQQALDAHNETSHFKKLVPEMFELAESASIKTFSPIA